MNAWKKAALAGGAVLVVAFAWATYKVVRAHAYTWLPDYARHVLRTSPVIEGTRHVIFLHVDHYEPGRGEVGVQRNREWLDAYRALADRHRDSYGRRFQHTWFYAYDHGNAGVMLDLSRAVHEGYGEVEFHWHHGNDDNAVFPGKLSAALDWFRSFGAMVSAEGKTSFGFIHGNWTLDDSGPRSKCGVSREITFLKDAGCYGDFTFPAPANTAQPRKVNSIFYAVDDDGRKSHETGVDAAVGAPHPDRFMIFQGPLELKLGRRFIDSGAIEERHEPSPDRVDRWINAGIAVQGRPEWTFVKIYSHGIQGRRVVFSPDMDRTLSHLEEKYGKGDWRLHYVTAREAYNIVRAAEDGKTGDPDSYRDYVIKPPLNALVPFPQAVLPSGHSPQQAIAQ